MLWAEVDDVGDGDNVEQLWTKRVGTHEFELCCIPFFAYDLALGDVVHANESSGWVIQSVVRRSGNGVVRVAVTDRSEEKTLHVPLHDLLGRLDYLCEWFTPGYVAVNIEPQRDHDELLGALTEFGSAIEFERILM